MNFKQSGQLFHFRTKTNKTSNSCRVRLELKWVWLIAIEVKLILMYFWENQEIFSRLIAGCPTLVNFNCKHGDLIVAILVLL